MQFHFHVAGLIGRVNTSRDRLPKHSRSLGAAPLITRQLRGLAHCYQFLWTEYRSIQAQKCSSRASEHPVHEHETGLPTVCPSVSIPDIFPTILRSQPGPYKVQLIAALCLFTTPSCLSD